MEKKTNKPTSSTSPPPSSYGAKDKLLKKIMKQNKKILKILKQTKL